MDKFYIYETQLCEVTFVREIEANDAAEARDKDLDESGRLVGVSIGDLHPSSVATTDVLPATPNNIPGWFYYEGRDAPVYDAAPDMLAALKLARPRLHQHLVSPEQLALIDTAIAKAEGRT